jgi:simple sugar transport system permease protein
VLRGALVPGLALVTAFGVGAVVIVLTDLDHLSRIGTDPMGALGGAFAGVIEGYRALLAGAIGDPGRIVEAIRSGQQADIAKAIRPLTEALLGSTPFIFVGLGLAVAFRAGLLNLGADGQFLMGGLGATLTVLLTGGALPPFATLVLGLVGGILFGAGYGFIPGFLKARTGAHEVITTLMLNVIAPGIALTVMRSIELGGSRARFPSIPRIFDMPTVRLDWGFVVALLIAPVVSFLLFRTTLGFELRATGFNPSVARSAGMRPGRTTVLAMTISGGLAGMASAFTLLGPGAGNAGGPLDLGFVALALALVGGLRPSGVVLAALVYGALSNGATTMVIATGVPLALLVVIVAVAMLLIAAPGLVRSIWRLSPPAFPGETTTYVEDPASPL